MPPDHSRQPVQTVSLTSLPVKNQRFVVHFSNHHIFNTGPRQRIASLITFVPFVTRGDARCREPSASTHLSSVPPFPALEQLHASPSQPQDHFSACARLNNCSAMSAASPGTVDQASVLNGPKQHGQHLLGIAAGGKGPGQDFENRLARGQGPGLPAPPAGAKCVSTTKPTGKGSGVPACWTSSGRRTGTLGTCWRRRNGRR